MSEKSEGEKNMHQIPSDKEIRDRITSTKDKQKRFLFMYQYETLGRISEIAGKYMPRAGDSFIIDIDGTEAALFAVKTAKRRGKLRPCAVPTDKKYDPWAAEVYDYLNSHKSYEEPFRLHENTDTSKTYAMNEAKQMFDGFMWPMIDYTRSMARPYTKDLVISERYGDKGYKEYLVVFPDGFRTWTQSESTVRTSLKIEERWKQATSHVIRKRRTLTLALDYKYSGIDLAIMGGWTHSAQEQNMPQAIKHYLFLNITEARGNEKMLKELAKRYFEKLLIPFDRL